MKRSVQPEFLDSLPPDDPAARHSRRDLIKVNRLMGNFRWFARILPPLLRPGDRILEIGAGTAELALRLGRAGVPVDALDLCPPPPAWPAERIWHRADLHAFGGFGRYTVFIGNLVFHHFDDAELTALGARLRPTARLVLASEPSRSRLSQLFCRVVGPVSGAHRVTRHDAHVSIAAGFRGHELARTLGLDAGDWTLHTPHGLMGANRLVALRRP
ncbi:MAG TPA: methyltransferase domain-containing protein [Opitutus sp.]|nr:methyltransferase domain-containing protein [Opitutus sp.]